MRHLLQNIYSNSCIDYYINWRHTFSLIKRGYPSSHTSSVTFEKLIPPTLTSQWWNHRQGLNGVRGIVSYFKLSLFELSRFMNRNCRQLCILFKCKDILRVVCKFDYYLPLKGKGQVTILQTGIVGPQRIKSYSISEIYISTLLNLLVCWIGWRYLTSFIVLN